MNRIKADILIIGSGAAGGVLAGTLSEMTGKRIVLVEKGGHYTREFFNQRELDMKVLYAEEGTRFTRDGAIPVRGGQCVGGGTTVNIALSFNPVQKVWEGWRRDFGLEGFSFDPGASDYGVKGLNFSRCLADVRERINVHAPQDSEINDNNRLFDEGCRRLGVLTKRFELNMRGCIGCGYCAEGCSYDHKQGTMITYIADAIKRGVEVIHHCDIERLEFRKKADRWVVCGAAGRVRPQAPGSQPNRVAPGPLSIEVPLVLVCAGAIESPSLLMRSGHPNPHNLLGRGLVLHPSLPVVGLMDREISNFRGISGSYYSDHFYESRGFYFECLFGHPVYGSVILPRFGLEHFEWILNYRRLAGFGTMLVDRSSPSNRVEWDARGKKPVIHYRLTESDGERLRFAAQTSVEVMFAAGAREVVLPSEEPLGPLPYPKFSESAEAALCRHLKFTPQQTTLTSAHCQATVKMSEDPKLAILNSRGESHHVKNLIVCDSSSFPASCGANPMVSIMTMARYQGWRIAAEFSRYDT